MSVLEKGFFWNSRFADERNRSTEKARLLAFFHAQRTGGSQFKEFLRRVFGDNGVYAQQTVNGYVHWDKLSECDLDDYPVFAGHSNYGGQQFTKRELDLISILRDPVYRVASLHPYCQRKEGHALQVLAQRTDLEAFVVEGLSLKPGYFSDVQCRRICGKADARLAIEYIEQRFLAVGYTGFLGGFTRKLADEFGWDAEPLADVDDDSERYEPVLTNSVRKKIVRCNREDLKLFDYMFRKYFSRD